MSQQRRAPIRINALSFAKMMRCLTDDPHTIVEIAREVGLSPSTVRKYVFALKREKLVRIASWGQDVLGRSGIAEFQVGSGPDVKRQPKSRAETNARYRAASAARRLMRALTEKAEA